MKQNVKYDKCGYNFIMQFDFCPRCGYFHSCYSMDRYTSGNLPNYINEECFDELREIKKTIRNIILSESKSGRPYPWAKSPEEITDDEIDMIEELCAGTKDDESIYAAITTVIGNYKEV